MNPLRKPIFTEHRRKRLTLWALTVLAWLADVLFGGRDANERQFAQRLHHICLDRIARTARVLLVDRALELARTRARRRGFNLWRRGRNLARRHFMRSFLGARFRRLLKHKDLRERIARLAALLTHLDTHARRLARRLRNLNRLWRVVPRIAPAALMLGPPAPSPALADSS